MKTCSYCGKEYPDDAVVCELDQQPLVFSKPKPPINSPIAPKKHQSIKRPITISRVLSAFGFAVLSGLCGVGLSWIVVAELANHVFKKNSDEFVAGSLSILTAGGFVGFIVGFVILLKVAKADPITEEEMEKKYVGLGGRWMVFSGVPIFVMAVLSTFFEKLLRTAGSERGAYIALGIAAVIFLSSKFLYDRISSSKFIIPIGIIAWLLTLSMAIWFFFFGPGAWGHP